MKNLFFSPVIFLILVSGIFFQTFFTHQLLPIPSDTIIGLYHPFRDLYANNYPNGIPFKNSLITDPIRQQYPWRELSISLEKKFELPLWDPYAFSGYPLLANQQSAAFYPLNILFWIFPFSIAWSYLIFLQTFLAGAFLYFYLRNLKISTIASAFGAVTFAFCGFSISWMEWGTVMQTALWLPLLLLCVDKIVVKKKPKYHILYALIFIFSLASSFLAGHLQVFFYAFLVTVAYSFIRWWQNGKDKKTALLLVISYSLFVAATAVQWLPTLQFILLSARNIDLNWQKDGWFLPWQNLVQFLAPDFFGNPTTLNYWGVWNYGEFIGYIGVVPLFMALVSLLQLHDKKTYFFGAILLFSLILALPTPLAQLPYILHLPFLSTAQPTRLMFLIDFSLAILAALGFDFIQKNNNRKHIFIPAILLSLLYLLLFAFLFFVQKILLLPADALLTAKHNIYFPIGMLLTMFIVLGFYTYTKDKKLKTACLSILLLLTIIDLFRFGWKYTPFTQKNYLFPATKTLSFLQSNIGNNRLMTTDSQILPPNFSVMYRLQSVDGYDPLYLLRYGEFISASERGKPDISSPFGFNRIITPHKIDSKLINLLGVKYVLSLTDIKSSQFKKVFAEGQTQVYENKNVLPRAFFVEKVEMIGKANDQQAINILYDKNFNAESTAVVQDFANNSQTNSISYGQGKATIVAYTPDKVIIDTTNDATGFLVLTDLYYPTWRAKIDGFETAIYLTDFLFRGILVPKGNHTIVFYDSLF